MKPRPHIESAKEPRRPRVDRSALYRGIDFRAHPELYKIGRGEEGVLTAEPYKGELLPLWRFRTPAIAAESARALWRAFVAYRKSGDFVGMDLARKFLQMGYTRARRYANHASGRKYTEGGLVAPLEPDGEKALAAEHFLVVWKRAAADPAYRALAARARAEHG